MHSQRLRRRRHSPRTKISGRPSFLTQIVHRPSFAGCDGRSSRQSKVLEALRPVRYDQSRVLPTSTSRDPSYPPSWYYLGRKSSTARFGDVYTQGWHQGFISTLLTLFSDIRHSDWFRYLHIDLCHESTRHVSILDSAHTSPSCHSLKAQ
jgi:hypothetical protein